MDAAQFQRWADERESAGDINHYELLSGVVVAHPPSGWPHGHIGATVSAAFHEYAAKLGHVLGASQGYQFPSGDVVQPDMAFVSHARWKARPTQFGEFVRAVPELVVEIAEPATDSRDRGEKRGIYERNGVLEYWIIDATNRSVQVFVARDGRLVEHAVAEGRDAVKSLVLDGFVVALASIFE